MTFGIDFLLKRRNALFRPSIKLIAPLYMATLMASALLIPLTAQAALPQVREVAVHLRTNHTARLYAAGEKLALGGPPTFSCDGEIHLEAIWRGLSPGRHELEIRWTDSREEVWERTRDAFTVGHQSQEILSDYWFAFKRSTFERFTGFELGASKKAGRWRVNVFLDDAPVAAKRYWVDC